MLFKINHQKDLEPLSNNIQIQKSKHLKGSFEGVGGGVHRAEKVDNEEGQHKLCNFCPRLKKLNWSPPKPSNMDIRQSFFSNKTIESPKKSHASATLLLSNLAPPATLFYSWICEIYWNEIVNFSLSCLNDTSTHPYQALLSSPHGNRNPKK